MTSQSRKIPKVAYLTRLTYENYDFLYRQAAEQDTSIAKALNSLIEERRSNIKICAPTKERVMVN